MVVIRAVFCQVVSVVYSAFLAFVTILRHLDPTALVLVAGLVLLPLTVLHCIVQLIVGKEIPQGLKNDSSISQIEGKPVLDTDCARTMV